MNGRQFISLTLTLGCLAIAGHASAVVLEVGSGKSFSTISAAAAAAASGDEIMVGANGIGLGMTCAALYNGEAIDAAGKALAIYPNPKAGPVCVTGIGSAPVIRFNASGTSRVEGFQMWINGSAPAFDIRNSDVLIADMASIGASGHTAILGRQDATIDLQRSWVNDSIIGMDLRSNAQAMALDNLFSNNDLAFKFRGKTQSDILFNEITGNAAVCIAMHRANTTFADNIIRQNENGCRMIHRSESAFDNNLWVKNGSDDTDIGLVFAHRAQGKVWNNTFDRNDVGAAIRTAGMSQVSVRDTLITGGTYTGIACYSTIPTTLEFSGIFNNPIPMMGCTPGAGMLFADPIYAVGPLGDNYLDQKTSPAIDAGSGAASAAFPTGGKTTNPTHSSDDTGTVDMGYHYPL